MIEKRRRERNEGFKWQIKKSRCVMINILGECGEVSLLEWERGGEGLDSRERKILKGSVEGDLLEDEHNVDYDELYDYVSSV